MKRADHSGKQYGNLIAVRFVECKKTESSEHTYWLFKCLCGQESVKSVSHVMRGKFQSCGCKNSEMEQKKMRQKPHPLSPLLRAYQAHRNNATKRGLVSYLTRDQYIKIIQQPCTYCGFSYRRSYVNNKPRNDSIPANSADRRNNEPYYKVENSISACFICQIMKNKHPETFFIDHIKKIVEHTKSIVQGEPNLLLSLA